LRSGKTPGYGKRGVETTENKPARTANDQKKRPDDSRVGNYWGEKKKKTHNQAAEKRSWWKKMRGGGQTGLLCTSLQDKKKLGRRKKNIEGRLIRNTPALSLKGRGGKKKKKEDGANSRLG